jgi:CDP-diacylglycerol--serine O-phosphatidyltransferase
MPMVPSNVQQALRVALPNALTLGNAACGFAAIVFASKAEPGETAAVQYLAYAGWCLLAAMLFDLLDGLVARLVNGTSEFGCQLDSLCDAISFGVAPGFLLYAQAKQWTVNAGQVASLVAVLYVLCAVVRLARFNVAPAAPVEKKPGAVGHSFTGLPSPVAAGCVGAFAWIGHLDWMGTWTDFGGFPEVQYWMLPGCLVAALLMVSPFPYAHLAKDLLRKGSRQRLVLPALLFLALAVVSVPLALAVLFWAYALVAPFRALFVMLRRKLRVPSADMERGNDTPSRWRRDR